MTSTELDKYINKKYTLDQHNRLDCMPSYNTTNGMLVESPNITVEKCDYFLILFNLKLKMENMKS